MTRIAAVHGALPSHRHTQREVTDMVARTCLPPGADRRVLDRLHENARVRSLHTVLPLDGYRDLDGFGPSNDVFIRSAVDLGAQAVRGALRTAGLRPTDVDLLMFTSVTGIAAPSIDARLVTRLGSVRRPTTAAPTTSTWPPSPPSRPASRRPGLATPVRGACPPRQPALGRRAGRVLLVGDAAGYVDALTGEGIALAEAPRRRGRLPDRRAARGHPRHWARVTRRYRLLTAALLGAAGHPASGRLIVAAAHRAPAVFRTAVRALQ
ncbi:hypothetical protein SBADM41S_05106 [Streptomyces badius]